MRPSLRSSRGITIIETTVILSVLFILAGVMSPIVSESVTTARAIKARSDASMIAAGLVNLQKDVGTDASMFGGAAPASLTRAQGLPDVLASGGEAPSADERLDVEPATGLMALTAAAGGRADRGGRPPASSRRRWFEMAADALDDHLMTNRRGYRYRQPGEYGGWNGPYVSAQVKGDPWGNQYLVNTHWLDGGATAATGDGRLRRAVYVVSAGSNGIIETPFEQSIVDARAQGDDIVIRLQ